MDIDTKNLDQLSKQLNNLNKLVEINRIINSTLDIGKLLNIIMEIIKDIMEAEASTLLLYEENTKDLVFKVALGEAGKELTERYRVKMGQGIAGWVAKQRKPLYINDAYNDERFDPNFDKKTGFKTKAIICAPLLFKGRFLGVIQAINPVKKQGFDEEDMAYFMTFADQAVLTVQNAIFFQNALEEERMKKEFSSAKSFQNSLLPAIDTQYNNISISARSFSAREVGGEFYDFIFYNNKQLGIALGDVQKKGISGALNASIIFGAVKGFAELLGNKPLALINNLQKIVYNNNETIQSVSIFYGLFSCEEKSITFINAGIAYAILIRNGRARYLKYSSDPLDGDQHDYKKIKLYFEEGDFFVIITDGLVNLRNKKAQTLGLKSIIDILSKQYKTTEEIVDTLSQLANNFTENLERREDFSIISLKID